MKSWQEKSWLPTMDSNHDKQIQSLLCYRYTSRQFELGNHSALDQFVQR